MWQKSIQVCCVLLFATLNSLVVADHGREIRPKIWQQDATINDIFALNDKHAWAVGDQGLIMLTNDGGETWSRSAQAGLDLDEDRTFSQKLGKMRPISQTHELYPLTCTFNSVFFLNESRGWVAGYYHTPYLDQARSVLLTTDDGGLTWQQFKTNLLPKISRIFFQDLFGGWAIGSAGNLYKSGVFATSSGGLNWNEQEVKPSRNWIDGELIPDGFVVIDDEGIIGRIKGHEFEPSIVFGKRASRLCSIRMLDKDIGWAVGHNGTILQTRDGGLTWKRPAKLVDHKQLELFDFETLYVREGKVWIAGNPGTFVVTLDARTGSDLKLHSTPVALPIKKLCFSSKTKGWAVGANGQIMSTSDGGENWEIQRIAHQRTSILIASQDTRDLPFGLVSFFSDENNKLSSVALLGEQSQIDLDIAQASMNRVGCSMQMRLLGTEIQEELAKHSDEQLLSELVRAIRTARPTVLVCNQMPGTADNRLHVLCRTAIEMAADPKSFPQQIEELDLENWQVDRYLIRQASGDVVFSGRHYMPRVGKLLEDQVAISRALTGLPIGMDNGEFFQVESFTGSITATGNDIFFGLKQLGHEIPKRRHDSRFGNLNAIAIAPLKNSELERLVTLPVYSSNQMADLHREVRRFATGIGAEEAGIWLMQLAERYLSAGKMEAAAFSLEELVRRNQDHPLAPASLMWLAQYYSSDEVSATFLSESSALKNPQSKLEPSILKGNENKFVRSNATAINDNGVRLVAWEVEVEDTAAKNELKNDSAVEEEPETIEKSTDAEFAPKPDKKTVRAVVDFRTQKASEFLSKLKQYDLDFAQNDQVRFLEAMILSKVPGNYSHENLLKKISRSRQNGHGLASAVRRELKARKKKGSIKVPRCYYTNTRPQLDGELDDELWQHGIENGKAIFKPMTPRGLNQSSKNDVCWMAFDDQFLFVAVRCNRLENHNYRNSKELRQRDTDLSRFDRIRFKLDFDRDLRSEFQFEVDYRGWAFDSCAGAKGWNPDWFIAVGGDDNAWTAEFAIPLNSLTPKSVDKIEYTAFSIQRLDGKSMDLWSDSQNRKPQNMETGFVAGLSIKAKQLDLLEFISADDSLAEADEIK